MIISTHHSYVLGCRLLKKKKLYYKKKTNQLVN